MTGHTHTLDVVETPDGRRFRSVCSCGWASRLEYTNRCAGLWRRHAAAMRRRAAS